MKGYRNIWLRNEVLSCLDFWYVCWSLESAVCEADNECREICHDVVMGCMCKYSMHIRYQIGTGLHSILCLGGGQEVWCTVHSSTVVM